MNKNKTIFVCQECGSSQSKWSGQCDKCGTWNSLLEEALPNRGSSDNIHHGKIKVVESTQNKGTLIEITL